MYKQRRTATEESPSKGQQRQLLGITLVVRNRNFALNSGAKSWVNWAEPPRSVLAYTKILKNTIVNYQKMTSAAVVVSALRDYMIFFYYGIHMVINITGSDLRTRTGNQHYQRLDFLFIYLFFFFFLFYFIYLFMFYSDKLLCFRSEIKVTSLLIFRNQRLQYTLFTLSI